MVSTSRRSPTREAKWKFRLGPVRRILHLHESEPIRIRTTCWCPRKRACGKGAKISMSLNSLIADRVTQRAAYDYEISPELDFNDIDAIAAHVISCSRRLHKVEAKRRSHSGRNQRRAVHFANCSGKETTPRSPRNRSPSNFARTAYNLRQGLDWEESKRCRVMDSCIFHEHEV